MKKDYRVSGREAANRTPLSILDTVVYNMYDDCDVLTDDAAVAALAAEVDPLLFYIFSAWMARTDLMVGGVFYIFEQNCKQIITSSLEGFKLLKTKPIADIIVKACQIFPSGIIPDRHSDILGYLDGGDDWAKVEDAVNRGDFLIEKFTHVRFDGVEVFEKNKFLFVK